MKRAFGVIEILIAFLLVSVIVAGCMHMTLIQMEDGRLEHARLEEAQNKADEMIDNIQNIRARQLEDIPADEAEKDIEMMRQDILNYNKD